MKIDDKIVDSIRVGLNNIIDKRPDIIDALHTIFSDDGISAALKKIMNKSSRCAWKYYPAKIDEEVNEKYNYIV